MLRPLLFFLLLRQRAEIKKQWAVAHEYVAASIEKKIGNGGALDEPPTMLDHLITDKKLGQAGSLNEQLRNQMILSAVGTLTTFNSVIQCLYDLSTHPEYIAELRDEVSKAQRDENGHFTKESLRSMRKLDSFLKESQRLSSPDLCELMLATHHFFLSHNVCRLMIVNSLVIVEKQLSSELQPLTLPSLTARSSLKVPN
jgi:cytochrome P450